MPKTRAFSLQAKQKDSYLELIRSFPLASIQSEEHLTAAQAVLDRLLALGAWDPGTLLYLDALSDLVAAFEDVHHPMPAASDADLLRHFLEAKGVSQAQLSRDLGIPKSTVSEVLSGKRPFSRQMIRKLATYFQVDLSLLAANL